MLRIRRSVLTAFALCTLVTQLAFAAPSLSRKEQPSGPALAIVSIDKIGYDRWNALTSSPALAWWVELDTHMLVSGDRAALDSFLGGRFAYRYLEGAASTEGLYFTNRFPAGEIEAVGATILISDGGSSVIRATPTQISSLEGIHAGDDEEGCRGHATIRPFQPNMQLSHQAANSRIPATAEFNIAIQGMVDSINGQRWYADNQTLTTYNRWSRGTDILNARDWLVAQFQAMPGLSVTTQAFTVPASGGNPAVTRYNVIATLPGTTRVNDWYIVGAHYDAISNDNGHATATGAEDNGSGTTGVLELARIFTANPPDATMMFICYSGEEQGLHGSIAHAQSIVNAGDTSKVKGMFNIDMIGYTGDTDLDCRLETRAIGQGLMDACAAAAAQYTTLRIVTSLSPCCSDHAPYLDRSMPAILAIENDYGTYPGYHHSSDLSINLTIDMAVQILKMYVATIAQMVGTTPAGLGMETAGVYLPSTGTFFLRNSNSPGGADVAFQFGAGGGGFVPVAGDWNGDGVDTIGIYNPATSTFFLRNTNSPGGADVVLSFGAGGAGYVPLVGDWDGNGTDTVGLYQPTSGAFFLRNSNTPGGADLVFTFGPPNAMPVVGDWDGSGTTTVGIFISSNSTWFLRNSNTPGGADITLGYGPGGTGWMPIVGDWNNDNAQTVGLYDPGTGSWFLRNSNSPGPGTTVFGYGPTGVVPVRGDWNGL